MVVFGQEWLYSGKVAVLWQNGCIRAKVAVIGQSGCFRAKNGPTQAKVVVFG